MVKEARSVGDDHDALFYVNLHGTTLRDKVASDATYYLLTVVFHVGHALARSDNNPVVSDGDMPDMHLGDAFHTGNTHNIGSIIHEGETKLVFQSEGTVGEHHTHATACVENKLVGTPLYLHWDQDSATTELYGDGVAEILLHDLHFGDILSACRQSHGKH